MIVEFSKYKDPQVGDWVIDISGEFGIIEDILHSITTTTEDGYEEWNWESNVGKNSKNNGYLYVIRYDTKYNKKEIYKAWRSEIKEFGTKEKIMIILQSNKYNL